MMCLIKIAKHLSIDIPTSKHHIPTDSERTDSTSGQTCFRRIIKSYLPPKTSAPLYNPSHTALANN